MAFTLRIEQGDYCNICLAGRGRTYSDVASIKAVFGNDYDRAYDDNSLLTISGDDEKKNSEYTHGQIHGGYELSFSGSSNRNNITFDIIIKCGTLQGNRLGDARGDESIYIGSTQASGGNLQYIGKRRITIEGGSMASIASGMNNKNVNYGVNDGGWAVMVRMRGGTVRGSIYGAASFAEAVGDRVMIFTGGTVGGWIAGGCNGYKSGSGGKLDGDTYLYIGGRTQVGVEGDNTKISTSTVGNIFGAGSGYSKTENVGQVDNSTIVVSDACKITRNVYGGGNFGFIGDQGSKLYILGGTVQGKVFGGANQRSGKQVGILMRGGLVLGGVYGGSNEYGTVTGPVTLNIEGGTVGATGIDPTTSEEGHVFGCGFGENTSVSGAVNVYIGSATGMSTPSTFPCINGNVYCGGHNAPHTVSGAFQVTGRNGKVKGSIFGGGKGETAVITGSTSVLLQGSIEVFGNVYGGGHRGKVTGNTAVRVER